MPSAGAVCRPGVFSIAAKSFRILSGALLLWCGLALTWVGVSGWLAEERYRTEAAVVPAHVLRKAIHPATSSTSTRYEVTYRATLPDGSPMQRTETIDVSAWERLEAGSELQLQYVPDRRDSLRIARESDVVPHAVPTAIGLALAPAGAMLFAFGARDVRRRIHVYRHGMPAEAVVAQIEETNVRVNGRVQWRLRFSYRDHLGSERQGTSEFLSFEEATSWRPGDTGRVLFDRDCPQVAVWIGNAEDPSS